MAKFVSKDFIINPNRKHWKSYNVVRNECAK